MAGGKLKLVKAAALFVARHMKLAGADRLGIVTYDTEVYVDAPIGSDVAKAESAIKSINAGSMTNLSGGLFEGIRLLKEAPAASGDEGGSRVQSVLLLTDGQANSGITDTARLTHALEAALDDTKISVSTFGFGASYNEEMLCQLAEVGRGSQYHVTGEDNMGAFFADSLGGLLSVQAQNVVLTSADGQTFKIGDMYAEERRDFIIEAPRDQAGVSLSYFDVGSGQQVNTGMLPVDVELGPAKSSTPNPEVMIHRARADAADLMKVTTKKEKKARMAAWRTRYDKLESPEVVEIAADLKGAEEQMDQQDEAHWRREHTSISTNMSKQRAYKAGKTSNTTSAKMAMQAMSKNVYGDYLSELS
jgi:hypothetical protein